ncbi:MAG: glycosyltransferase family 87 protein [Myxococcota bacterium]|nr:glycosyltransferase family 87 protein [Myxococcota bacterium]
MKRFPTVVICFSCIALLGLFFYTVWFRFFYPYDLEWMEGGVLLHGLRVMEGKPLYAAPTSEFICFIYPPLYYWLLALGGYITELDYPVGRLVSIVGTLVAAWAIVSALRYEKAAWPIAFAGGVFFLSTYEDTGAFFDIVRGDGLLIALMAWSMVWVRRGRLILGGVLLCVAFMTKHNAAILGFPMMAWLWRYRSTKEAWIFASASAIPALLFTGYMEWSTDGFFLTYLLGVPAHHPFVAWRFLWLSHHEISSALILMSAFMIVLTSFRMLTEEDSKKALRFVLYMPILLLVLLLPTELEMLLSGIPISAVGSKMVGQIAIGVLLWTAVLPLLWWARHLPCREGTRFWLYCGTVLCFFSAIMRAHHGGYNNVLIPGMWAFSLWGAFAMHWVWTHHGLRILPAMLIPLQLFIARWNPDDFIPTAADYRGGEILMTRLAQIDGPIFAPHSPWYPVKVGQPPSAHLIAIWDIKHPTGPLAEHVRSLREDIENQRFAAILLANTKEDYGRKEHYRKTERLRLDEKPAQGRKKALMPKKGWPVRPQYLFFPK